MLRLLGRLKPRQLFLSWVAYWAGLAVVTLTPAAIVLWRQSRPGSVVSAGASITDGVLKLTVTAPGSAGWTGSMSLITLALLVAAPAIALWVCWLAATSKQAPADAARGPEQLNRGDELPLRGADRAKSERSRDAG